MISSYEKALKPHIEWIKEQIVNANERIENDRKEKDVIEKGEAEIGIKLIDLKTAMGPEFINKHNKSVYQMVKDILLENGIKMRQGHAIDGEKVLYLSFAEESRIISATEARYLRLAKTAKNKGITGSYITNYDHLKGKYGHMDENPECSHYFGTFVEREYVMSVFEDVKIFEYPKDEWGRRVDTHKPYDWICKNGYKVKHAASCIRTDNYHTYRDGTPIPYFNFSIKRNEEVDYWMLSAWDNRDSLVPMFVWMIKGKEDFITQAGRRPFWDRDYFKIYITKKGLDRMSGYEIEKKLEELIDICSVAKILGKNEKNIVNEEDILDLSNIFPR